MYTEVSLPSFTPAQPGSLSATYQQQPYPTTSTTNTTSMAPTATICMASAPSHASPYRFVDSGSRMLPWSKTDMQYSDRPTAREAELESQNLDLRHQLVRKDEELDTLRTEIVSLRRQLKNLLVHRRSSMTSSPMVKSEYDHHDKLTMKKRQRTVKSEAGLTGFSLGAPATSAMSLSGTGGASLTSTTNSTALPSLSPAASTHMSPYQTASMEHPPTGSSSDSDEDDSEHSEADLDLDVDIDEELAKRASSEDSKDIKYVMDDQDRGADYCVVDAFDIAEGSGRVQKKVAFTKVRVRSPSPSPTKQARGRRSSRDRVSKYFHAASIGRLMGIKNIHGKPYKRILDKLRERTARNGLPLIVHHKAGTTSKQKSFMLHQDGVRLFLAGIVAKHEPRNKRGSSSVTNSPSSRKRRRVSKGKPSVRAQLARSILTQLHRSQMAE